jgi:hypothetical protein
MGRSRKGPPHPSPPTEPSHRECLLASERLIPSLLGYTATGTYRRSVMEGDRS